MTRYIPSTMATQHPDNARGPYWEKDGDGFISMYEEMDECVSAFRDLGIDEFMWDWEGKYADEAVIDKLFSTHYDYFKKDQIGKEKFLTFRLPNVWHEKGYSLLRALMVILTSDDFARDLGFHAPPLFEVILPMTETAEQMLYIQQSFHKLSEFKTKTFYHQKSVHNPYIDIIPLVESVESQIGIRTLLNSYLRGYRKSFVKKPLYLRPFLAGSDPALISGFLPSILASKIALSELKQFSRETGVETHPIIGVGSLLFRGGLSPVSWKTFIKEYAGIRTVTIQSAFRYDYPLSQVKQAIRGLQQELPKTEAVDISEKDKHALVLIIKKATTLYRRTLTGILPDVEPLFSMVPRRRERKLHIGLLAYKRNVGTMKLPRAITFTAGFYSLGIPPEVIATGRVIASLKKDELLLLERYYPSLRSDLESAVRFLNEDTLKLLGREKTAWSAVGKDIECLKNALDIPLGPRRNQEYIHKNLTSNLYLSRKNAEAVSDLITQTGMLRRSLG